MASTFTAGALTLTRQELFDLWRTSTKDTRVDKLVNYIVTKIGENSVTTVSNPHLKTFVKNISEQFRKKWVAKHRRLDIFNRQYSEWLKQNAQLPASVLPPGELSSDEVGTSQSERGPGRPPKDFASSSHRSKIRKVKHLVNNYDGQQLALATSVSIRNSGKRHAANIIQEVASASPKRSTRYKKAIRLMTKKKRPKKKRPYSPDEAVAFMVQNKLTVHQYKNMRIEAVERGYDIYPSYNKVSEAKKACYPAVEKITVTDVSVEISLQELLNHTVKRLCLYQKDVIESLPENNLILFCKWGLDGSSGHSLYKQTFNNENDTDEYLLSVSLVPLRLYSAENTNIVLWQNERPSSTRMCRPIKLIFRQETTNLIKAECLKIESEITALIPTEVEVDTKTVTVSCIMKLTMVDTKVVNAVTGTLSAQRRYICGLTPKDMNTQSSTRPPLDESVLSFGISSLHAWIRSFEAMLHIAYRLQLETKKWQVSKGTQDADTVEKTKSEIQRQFKLQMGLIVDKPKSGAGNTNDGNTARRFFQEAKVSSKITGLNKELLVRFDTVLRVLSSGFEIKTDKFEDYLEETRCIFLRLYDWYPMPVTVHKILFHSVHIIKNSLLPIGQMSEEAQEARNKEIRQIRQCHTRKISRVTTNMDMLLYLFVASDPFIAGLRKLPSKKTNPIPKNVLDLLMEPNL